MWYSIALHLCDEVQRGFCETNSIAGSGIEAGGYQGQLAATEGSAAVVAEHVQDDETMAFLAECRVEYAQGYHLGRPEEFPLEPPGGSRE